MKDRIIRRLRKLTKRFGKSETTRPWPALKLKPPAEDGAVLSAPDGLMLDLLSTPDRVWSNAYLTDIPLEKADQYLGSVQYAVMSNQFPHFSWICTMADNKSKQAAYQIIVADSREAAQQNAGNVWDSGKVNSAQSVSVRYTGPALKQHRIYFWKVRIWDTAANLSFFSKVQAFRTGSFSKGNTVSSLPLQKHTVIPQSIDKKEDGSYFIDFGKDAFGSLKLELFSEKDDLEVSIYLGEVLLAPLYLHQEPGGGRRFRNFSLKLRKGRHTYLLQVPPDKKNTRAKAIHMPVYVGEVMPFRYAEVINYPHELSTHQVQQVVVNYPFDDQASGFQSDDSNLNRVWDLCKYSIKATAFAGIYVDGDRERIPYESDAYINQLGHYCTDREYAMGRKSLEYLLFHATWPTEWILHSVLMAYADYMYTGDSCMLARHYPLLKAKTLMELARKDGLISTYDIRKTRNLERSIHYQAAAFKGKHLTDIVDWPHEGILGLEEGEGGETDGFEFCQINTVVNAFHYKTLDIMQKVAEVLGKPQEAAFFSQRAAQVSRSFHESLLDKSRGIFVDGEGSRHASLHANMFPLAFGLVPPEYVASVVSHIKSRGMACSVYAAQYLLEALFEAGEDKYATELMTSTGKRSWMNMLEAGSTITLEAWDDCYKPNQDWNHAWGAAPANIIPRYLAGVRPLEAGFQKILVQPQPGHIRQFKAKVPTIRGPVKVNFFSNLQKVELELHLPANTCAKVAIPTMGLALTDKLLHNRQVIEAQREGDVLTIDEVPSGRHIFLLQ